MGKKEKNTWVSWSTRGNRFRGGVRVTKESRGFLKIQEFVWLDKKDCFFSYDKVIKPRWRLETWSVNFFFYFL